MEKWGKWQTCLHQSDVTISLPVLGVLYDILCRYAGEYHCKYGSLSSPRLAVQSARGLVEHQLKIRSMSFTDKENFPRIWENTLFLLLNIGKRHFNLRALNASKTELGPHSQPDEIKELESLQPYFPGICRLKQWLKWLSSVFVTAFWIILVVSFVLLTLYAIRLMRLRKLRALDKRSNRVRELVSEIVYLLQHQLRENETNLYQPPYIPVSVVRDRLRQKYDDVIDMWPDIMRYIYEVETCIAVKEWRGVGEIWQWQGGTGWQGSALIDKSQKPSFVIPPTECLKVRNMYSVDGIDERGKKRIVRELLKKLDSCGSIVHIGFDSIGSDGLVYIKCLDANTAGGIYHSIHANYFDSRLLTVKFLRDNKYCLRFPEARGLKQPLYIVDFE